MLVIVDLYYIDRILNIIYFAANTHIEMVVILIYGQRNISSYPEKKPNTYKPVDIFAKHLKCHKYATNRIGRK